jgi:predicted ATPase
VWLCQCRLVAEGRIQADPTQLAAVENLQLLQQELIRKVQENFLHAQQQQQQQQLAAGAFTADVNAVQDAAASTTTPSSSGNGSSGSSGNGSSSSSRLPVQGAYLWGPVGSGKTLLMDLFLKTLPAAQIPQAAHPNSSSNSSSSSSSDSMLLHVEAERLHFHTFMLGVHHQLHQLQQALPTVVGTSRAGLPVYRWAREITLTEVSEICPLFCRGGALYKQLCVKVGWWALRIYMCAWRSMTYVMPNRVATQGSDSMS